MKKTVRRVVALYMTEMIGIIELLAGAAMNVWIGRLGKPFSVKMTEVRESC